MDAPITEQERFAALGFAHSGDDEELTGENYHQRIADLNAEQLTALDLVVREVIRPMRQQLDDERTKQAAETLAIRKAQVVAFRGAVTECLKAIPAFEQNIRALLSTFEELAKSVPSRRAMPPSFSEALNAASRTPAYAQRSESAFVGIVEQLERLAAQDVEFFYPNEGKHNAN